MTARSDAYAASTAGECAIWACKFRGCPEGEACAIFCSTGRDASGASSRVWVGIRLMALTLSWLTGALRKGTRDFGYQAIDDKSMGLLNSPTHRTRPSARYPLSGGGWGHEVGSGPFRKRRRLLAGDFVGERDLVAGIRAQIRVRLEVGEHCCDTFGTREPAGERLSRDLLERDLVSLSIQGADDLVEAQEIADQRQMFAVSREFRQGERTSHDAAEFVDVAHVDDAPLGIKRQRPARTAICLLLRGHHAQQVLVVERSDHK